ncbi:MAG: hypothetical protein MJA83_06765 [Gammaproteobacteria bacterium]|nr:hypothetical protein [Gammaproteobacteria bacterium]
MNDSRGEQRLSTRLLRFISVGWVSFVTAGVASSVFFAAFDPEVLAKAATFPFNLSRNAGYTLGFLVFWLLTATTGFASIFLSRALDESERN